jgi:hypothetical protein
MSGISTYPPSAWHPFDDEDDAGYDHICQLVDKNLKGKTEEERKALLEKLKIVSDDDMPDFVLEEIRIMEDTVEESIFQIAQYSFKAEEYLIEQVKP